MPNFDRYVEEHDVQPGQYGTAFAQWLANIVGRPITGEPADGKGPTVTAQPEGAAGKP
jgi:hypothetical protein